METLNIPKPHMQIEDILFCKPNLINAGGAALMFIAKSAVILFAVHEYIEAYQTLITCISITCLCLYNISKFAPVAKRWFNKLLK